MSEITLPSINQYLGKASIASQVCCCCYRSCCYCSCCYCAAAAAPLTLCAEETSFTRHATPRQCGERYHHPRSPRDDKQVVLCFSVRQPHRVACRSHHWDCGRVEELAGLDPYPVRDGRWSSLRAGQGRAGQGSRARAGQGGSLTWHGMARPLYDLVPLLDRQGSIILAQSE